MAAAPSRVGFVGAGWRTMPYLLAMKALPEDFEPVGAVTRTEASAERMRAAHGPQPPRRSTRSSPPAPTTS